MSEWGRGWRLSLGELLYCGRWHYQYVVRRRKHQGIDERLDQSGADLQRECASLSQFLLKFDGFGVGAMTM